MSFLRKIRWRTLALFLHRELGCLFLGATLVYAISGIALNHRREWNPSYSVKTLDIPLADPAPECAWTRTDAEALLRAADITARYKSHYAPAPAQIRLFLENGTATYHRDTRRLTAELLQRRPLLHTFNKLHYNPGLWWTAFADAFCVALIIVAISGLLLLHRPRRLRSLLLAAIGVLIPAAFTLLNL
jgi:hypothetical protein